MLQMRATLPDEFVTDDGDLNEEGRLVMTLPRSLLYKYDISELQVVRLPDSKD